MNTASHTNTNVPVRKIIILLIMGMILFWVCICLAIWDGGYFLTSLAFTDPPRWKPSVNDIVGKWHLSEDSIKYIQDAGTEVPSHEVEFYADDTFKAANLPIFLGWENGKIILGSYTG